MKDMSGDRVEELASRMTVIDPQNALGHCYLAALAAQKGQEQILNQHLSNVMKCQLYTAYIDQYLTAHFSTLEKLNVPFYPVRKVYVIKGLSAGFLVPQLILREYLIGKADQLAKEGDTDAAVRRYQDALLLVGQPLTSRPGLGIVELHFGSSVAKIMTRMAEMWDKNGQSVRAEICRQTARVHDRHRDWMQQLLVRKVTLHRLAYCSHLNAGDLDYLNNFAEQFRLGGDTAAMEAAPDYAWLVVPPMHSVTEWDWQTGTPKE